jgi:hypothetical protein
VIFQLQEGSGSYLCSKHGVISGYLSHNGTQWLYRQDGSVYLSQRDLQAIARKLAELNAGK